MREGEKRRQGGGEAEEEGEEEDHPGEIHWDPHNHLFCHFSVSFKQTRFIGGKCSQLFSTLSFFSWGYSLYNLSARFNTYAQEFEELQFELWNKLDNFGVHIIFVVVVLAGGG